MGGKGKGAGFIHPELLAAPRRRDSLEAGAPPAARLAASWKAASRLQARGAPPPWRLQPRLPARPQLQVWLMPSTAASGLRLSAFTSLTFKFPWISGHSPTPNPPGTPIGRAPGGPQQKLLKGHEPQDPGPVTGVTNGVYAHISITQTPAGGQGTHWSLCTARLANQGLPVPSLEEGPGQSQGGGYLPASHSLAGRRIHRNCSQ